jgi:hypothetical protein
MAVSNSSMIGVNLNGVSDGATALFGLQSATKGTQDTEWVYVYANVGLATGQCVAINSGGTAVLATQTLAATGLQLAFAQGPFTAADFGWVAKGGNPIYILVSSVSTINGTIGVGDNASGVLTAGPASGALRGVAVLSANATSAATVVQAYVHSVKPLILTGLGAG